jgi:hypothetical protein
VQIAECGLKEYRRQTHGGCLAKVVFLIRPHPVPIGIGTDLSSWRGHHPDLWLLYFPIGMQIIYGEPDFSFVSITSQIKRALLSPYGREERGGVRSEG